jgi:(2Fe-2S) ferredoxin
MSKGFVNTPACVLYVCCGSKCRKRGGKHLFKQLKNSVKERSLKRKIQVIKTGCTDRCKMGPVVAVMPENTWHTEVDEQKANSIFEQVVAEGLDIR